MADTTLSLDDIIKNNKIAKKIIFAKTEQLTNGLVKRFGKRRPLKITLLKLKFLQKLATKLFKNKNLQIGNALDSLVQLARKGDARERLSKLTKKVDARDQLNKLKKSNLRVKATRNGKQAVATKLTREKVFSNKHTVAASRPMGNKTQQQTLHAPLKQVQVRKKNLRMQHASYQQQDMGFDSVWESRYPQEQVYHQQRPVMGEDFYSPTFYKDVLYVDKWGAPIILRPVYVEELVRRAPPVHIRHYHSSSVNVDDPISQPAPVSTREFHPLPSYSSYRIDQQQHQQPYHGQPNSATRMSRQKQRSQRQSQPQRQLQPQKQLQPQNKLQSCQGHKIMVSNLPSMVTGEDVKELFSTIGQITSFKMIREGVALIIFLESEDVLRAIEAFHNCQLDGLPMNVTTVKKKCQKVQN